jgi:hypothetical protein
VTELVRLAALNFSKGQFMTAIEAEHIRADAHRFRAMRQQDRAWVAALTRR